MGDKRGETFPILRAHSTHGVEVFSTCAKGHVKSFKIEGKKNRVTRKSNKVNKFVGTNKCDQVPVPSPQCNPEDAGKSPKPYLKRNYLALL